MVEDSKAAGAINPPLLWTVKYDGNEHGWAVATCDSSYVDDKFYFTTEHRDQPFEIAVRGLEWLDITDMLRPIKSDAIISRVKIGGSGYKGAHPIYLSVYAVFGEPEKAFVVSVMDDPDRRRQQALYWCCAVTERDKMLKIVQGLLDACGFMCLVPNDVPDD